MIYNHSQQSAQIITTKIKIEIIIAPANQQRDCSNKSHLSLVFICTRKPSFVKATALYTMATTVSQAWWISNMAIYLLGAIITFKILRCDIKSRKQSTFKFTTKSLQYTSKLCLYSGVLLFIFQSVFAINGLCIFLPFVGQIFLIIQFVSMGFHQLSRLYYCFSNDKIHSDKGYPKCLFVFMIIIGVLFCIDWPLIVLSTDHEHNIKSKCGIDGDFRYYYSFVNFSGFLPERSFTWFTITTTLYLIWDISTLLLYAFKIKLFKNYKNTQPLVYQRIVSILYKIFVITLFYEYVYLYTIIIVSLIAFSGYGDYMVLQIVSVLISNSIPIAISYCMYLMMDYNQDSYQKFLKVIYRTRFYLCCCCCRFMVVEQMEEVELKMQDKKNKSVTTNATTGGDVAEADTVAHTVGVDVTSAAITNETAERGVIAVSIDAGRRKQDIEVTSHPGSTPDVMRMSKCGWELSVETPRL